MTVKELIKKLEKVPSNYIVDIVDKDTDYSFDIHCMLLNYHNTVSIVKDEKRIIIDLVKERL